MSDLISKASCIIPTFGRNEEVLQTTLQSLFDLGDEFFQNCCEIFLIDQNRSPLNLKDCSFALGNYEGQLEYRFILALDPAMDLQSSKKVILYHFYGLSPSVTRAKNFAIRRSHGDVLLFFDDDVTVQPRAIHHHLHFQRVSDNIGILGGREIVIPESQGRSPFRNLVAEVAEKLTPQRPEENRYKINRQYVGRITHHSFFFCQFDFAGEKLVEVDTIRGCNGSLRRKVYDQVDGFDENFLGTALREESDFCLRIQKAGYTNYFFGGAIVLHRRQLGGCNNLAKSYSSLISKLECELYFQYKHFLSVSPLFFFARLLPLILEAFLWSWGMSLVFLGQFTVQLLRLQSDKNFRDQYESSFAFPIKK